MQLGLGARAGAQQGPIDINIPAGVDTGDQIEVQLAGGGGKRPAMRIAIPIEVEPHPVFRCGAAWGGREGAGAGAAGAAGLAGRQA